MQRIIGVLALLAIMYGMLYAVNPKAFNHSNQQDVLSQQAFYGILTLGIGVVIITGGIDLSMGSVIGFAGMLFGALVKNGMGPIAAMLIVLLAGILIGLIHGLFITQMRLQPFLVTLCGMFIYRGLARIIGNGSTIGLETLAKTNPSSQKQLDWLRQILVGKDIEGNLNFPSQLIVLLIVFAVLGLVLHFSIYGRYWYAIGHNELAARYAGIQTKRQKISVYIICSFLSALGGILSMCYYGSANPENTGVTLELYAITGAVLGGCSLRGGEGTVIGMVLGGAVLPLLKNLINFSASKEWVRNLIPNMDAVIPVIIGLTLLLGTLIDETLRRRSQTRKE